MDPNFDFSALRQRAGKLGVTNLTPEEYEARQKVLKERAKRQATLKVDKEWDACKRGVKDPRDINLWYDKVDRREV